MPIAGQSMPNPQLITKDFYNQFLESTLYVQKYKIEKCLTG